MTAGVVRGEVLGHGMPDWPDDLQTFAERMAYQRGVHDARALAVKVALTPVDQGLPPIELPVLVMCKGEFRIGELRWDHPGFEDTYQSYMYWDDPGNDGQSWEWFDITHWAYLPHDSPK